MKRHLFFSAVGCSLLLNLGCQAPKGGTEEVQKLEARVAALEQKVEALSSAPAAPSAAPSASNSPSSSEASASASSSASATPSSAHAGSDTLWQELSYESLPNAEKLKEIISLGFLPKAGISDQKAIEGELNRGQYVALLVEMNNLLAEPAGQIRLAREGDGQAFEDVPSSHPYYKYIQGMVDAGYVIGFNEKSFQPDKALTREEMVAIAAKRDFDFDGYDGKYHWDNYMPFTDKNDIAPKYRDAVSKDFGANDRSSLKQAFGELKLFHPKKPVRAYEAVLSLEGVGEYSHYTYNEMIKKSMNKPE